VVQVGIAWRSAAGEMQIWEQTCDPGRSYLAGGRADEALSINGLTPAVIQLAPRASAVARALRSKLVGIRKDHHGLELRAFNMSFDRPFLEAQPWNLKAEWGPCLMIQAARLFGSFNGRIPLWRACQEANIPLGARLHTAGIDARLALELHEFMRRKS
jgi:hypothetical protein